MNLIGTWSDEKKNFPLYFLIIEKNENKKIGKRIFIFYARPVFDKIDFLFTVKFSYTIIPVIK